MNILHINASDKAGGAGIAAFRLHTAMLESGIESRMLVLRKKGDSAAVTALEKWKSYFIAPLYNRYTKYRELKSYHLTSAFSTGMYGFNVSKHPLLQEADVIYLHWINGSMLSVKNVRQILALGKPVYWFMHDMWPITGGCHHSFDCSLYMTHCGACPCLSSDKEKDISYRIHSLKIKQFSSLTNLFAVTPSQWLGECCRKSTLFKNKRVTVIPNLIDTNLYKPVNKQVARSILNLPENKKLILFGADMGTENPYKGWIYLEEALLKIEQKDCEVVVFGNSHNSMIVNAVSMPIHFVGRLNDDYSLILLYSAIDVFVCPSMADNFPNTIVEAMACKALVVGFNVGGIPDLIQHTQTGYLASYKEASDLARGIDWCLEHSNDSEIKDAARIQIEKYCSYLGGISLHLKMLNNTKNDLR